MYQFELNHVTQMIVLLINGNSYQNDHSIIMIQLQLDTIFLFLLLLILLLPLYFGSSVQNLESGANELFFKCSLVFFSSIESIAVHMRNVDYSFGQIMVYWQNDWTIFVLFFGMKNFYCFILLYIYIAFNKLYEQ